MPDIFGREPEDYAVIRQMREDETWDRYQEGNAERRPHATPMHDFDALGSGVPAAHERAAEDQQALGYLTNNLLALQSAADEILYTDYRLDEFLSINTDIDEGARTYGVRVRDRVGRAQRITAPGFEAPSATASETIVDVPIHWYGLDAEWSVDELRGAMMAGTPLDTESIEAAVTGTMETMEAVGLTGGDYAEKGLLNQPITGTGAVNHNPLGVNMTFAEQTPDGIRTLITGEISKVIEESKETLGRNINMGMTVYLPGLQYDLLTSRYIGDNAERTIMRTLMEDNPWTHFTKGQPLNIERVLELDGIGQTSSDRMVVALKHPRICEMGVSIMPRVLRILDKGRVICAQVEGKFSSVFMKRPQNVYYTDMI